MTKASFIRATRGLHNKTIVFEGFNIRRRTWEVDHSWHITDTPDFDTANTLQAFYYRDELWDYIKNNQ